MKIRLFRALGFSICIALLIGLSASASPALAENDTPPKPEFAFSSDEALTADPKKPAEFILLNHSTERLELKLGIKGLTPPAAEGKTAPGAVLSISTSASALVPLKEGKVTLESGGVIRLYLHVNAQEWDKVKPDTYTGFLVAADPEKSQKAIQREVKLVVPDPQAQGPLPEPLYEAWTLKAVREPISDAPECIEPCYLPLKVDDEKNIKLPDGGSLLGYLTGPDGKQVEVWAKEKLTPASSPHGVKLEFHGTLKPGAYTAKLDLLPDDKDKGAITLTVNVTHDWFWPVFTLIAGLVAAMLIQRHIGVGKKVRELEDRKTNLEKHPKKTAKIKNYILDLKKLDERFKKLQGQLDQLKNISAPKIEDSNKDYVAAIAELDAMEAQFGAWEGFEGNLKKLEEAIADFGTTEPVNRPPWLKTTDKWPTFHQDAKNKLEGKPEPVIALQDIIVLDDKVQKAAKLLGSWKKLSEEIQIYRTQIEILRKKSAGWPAEKYREDLYTADRLVNQAWGELWLAADADDLKERCTSADMLQVETLLLGLSSIDKTPTTSLDDLKKLLVTLASRPHAGWDPNIFNELSYSEDEQAFLPARPGMREFLGGIEEPKQHPVVIALVAKYPLILRFLREAGITGLALIIAVSTALASLYIGKNFGTFMDYLTIFTWGATSKALVDGLDFLGSRFKWTLK